MGCFARNSSASANAPCAACCRADRQKDDELSQASSARIAALTGRRGASGATTSPSGRIDSDCAQQARTLAPVVQRFDRYREALPSARAAADMNELGDKSGDEPSTKPCLTRLPVQADQLNQTLGMPPGTLEDSDLRNDTTGFRAAVYRDQSTGTMILVPRDTQPDSLVDWQANTRNGVGMDTPQYQAMRGLTAKLSSNDQVFDIAGYSKGGGLAQEGGLMNDLAQVRVFNSAGIPDEMLGWTGQSDFASLTSRTKLFSANGDFLTFMNTTTDPGQNIINARFLRNELAGTGSLVAPINIKTLNPSTRGQPDPTFAAQKAAYLQELDQHIEAMQTAYDTGAQVVGFPAVRAASKETIANSSTSIGNLLGAGSDQPTLGKLNQHKMQVVLDAMESDVQKDRQDIQQFMRACG